MTYSEYAFEIGKKLLSAHNNKDRSAAISAFNDAESTLEKATASEKQRKQFWSDVRKSFFSGRIRVEEQDNSSLHVLMNLIQSQLNAREGRK